MDILSNENCWTEEGRKASKVANDAIRALRRELSALSHCQFSFICSDSCIEILLDERLNLDEGY